MTVITSAMNTPRYGMPTFDCGGTQIRAHHRHLATVVTIRGAIDAVNVDRISDYTLRFILARHPLVLDLSGVNFFASAGISLLNLVDTACRAAESEWLLVAGQAVTDRLADHGDEATFPTTSSVHAALHCFADAISTRRQLLLPLVGKTA